MSRVMSATGIFSQPRPRFKSENCYAAPIEFVLFEELDADSSLTGPLLPGLSLVATCSAVDGSDGSARPRHRHHIHEPIHPDEIRWVAGEHR